MQLKHNRDHFQRRSLFSYALELILSGQVNPKEEAIRICKRNSNAELSVVTNKSLLENLSLLTASEKLIKAKEQLKTANEKIQDARAKALQNILDVKSKHQ